MRSKAGAGHKRVFSDSGFEVDFSLPYKRADVFNEVTKLDQPLGADGPSLKYYITSTKIRLGMTRQVVFNDDATVYTKSKLVEYVADAGAARAPTSHTPRSGVAAHSPRAGSACTHPP